LGNPSGQDTYYSNKQNSIIHRHIKELLKQQQCDEHQEFIDYSQTKIIRIESNKYSDLEKKYRIEGKTY
jgi:hypothetical protein